MRSGVANDTQKFYSRHVGVAGSGTVRAELLVAVSIASREGASPQINIIIMTKAHSISSTMMDGHSFADSSNDFRHEADSCNYNLSEWWYQLQRRLNMRITPPPGMQALRS
ncbi:hypothetical protein HYALB_00005203 [Hymenoscyphus albidus]|uniref:Uncharacterized protein n=1 Tax=Hymenoscyphus albidus TaxID=595503 RepID=A0A9N9LUJ0_9HELO|nr:hypothetical protein HYALB_00005203 [Hymenoscyphus albidus]